MLLNLFDSFLLFFKKPGLFVYLNEFINNKSYKKIKIINKNVVFFCPNSLIYWRIKTFFTKEPQTLKWIEKFENKQNFVFWDIGSNIGLYSIYNSIINNRIKTISFEPSTSNLRVLSRNISINNLEKKIQIFPLPLTDKTNRFMIMKEGEFIEGSALNSFGEKYNFQGKNFKSKMNYNTFGTSIHFLLDKKILKVPNYIKIDVDGIEHLILNGFGKYLLDKRIKSLNIEVNENFKEQYAKVMKIMKNNNFKLQKKFNTQILEEKSIFNKTFNFIFVRK